LAAYHFPHEEVSIEVMGRAVFLDEHLKKRHTQSVAQAIQLAFGD